MCCAVLTVSIDSSDKDGKFSNILILFSEICLTTNTLVARTCEFRLKNEKNCMYISLVFFSKLNLVSKLNMLFFVVVWLLVKYKFFQGT